jgi:hypothetical protein
VRYKAGLVVQGFTQRFDFDFNETYSPVMNGITFRYLISLTTQKCLSLQLMDVVTAYLYGSLDLDIYMKVSDEISVPNANVGHIMYCVKLNKSLYGLKQSERMWYNRLNMFLLNKGYSNNRDDNGPGLGRVNRKPDPQKNVVGLNLTPEPVGFCK